MIHRFLNAANVHRRFLSAMKPSARETKFDCQMEELTRCTSLDVEAMHKKMRGMVGLADDDMKAFAPLPDENDPGIFGHGPCPDDDIRTHVQRRETKPPTSPHTAQRAGHVRGALIQDERPRCRWETFGGLPRWSTGLHNSHLRDGPLFGTARTNEYGLDDGLKDETGRDHSVMQLVKMRVDIHCAGRKMCMGWHARMEECAREEGVDGMLRGQEGEETRTCCKEWSSCGCEERRRWSVTVEDRLVVDVCGCTREVVCTNTSRKFHVLRAALDVEGEEIFTTYTGILKLAASTIVLCLEGIQTSPNSLEDGDDSDRLDYFMLGQKGNAAYRREEWQGQNT
ncbi:hypothetical protein EV421DRAFT_1741553 [Armillaria borealis]|uniref:Uncharacterized protein n=1 Tax=Armillaria borealis TaxID=47425 RepID=A0AA39MH87_9AGAR|nr:hypothetical protein EV421DRAFT_1741553 [Armillaria borealis]